MRQFAVGAGLVDGLRQLVRQYLRDLVDRDVVLGGKLANHVAAEHLLQLIAGDRLDRDRDVLEVLLVATGGDYHLIGCIACADPGPGLRRRCSGENAHAVRSEVREPKSRALEQASERRVSAESGRNSMGFLVLYDSRDVDEVQAGLAGKRGQRLRQRLRGNIGDQLRGFN